MTVRVGRADDQTLYVEDTGPGIPPAVGSEVFDPGYTSADNGTGFGLTIVNRITQAHGWEVTLESSPEGGARFLFSGVDFDPA